ncbi:MAG: hypothetical protein WEC34_01120 [Acidimicrobiia bacterium]
MSRRVLLVAIALVGCLLAGAASVAGAKEALPDLIILATALVVAEQFELRPYNRAAIPLSFAGVIVLVRAADPAEFVAIVAVAYIVAVALRPEPSGLSQRCALYAERIVEAVGAGILFHFVLEFAESEDAKAIVLGGLAVAAAFEILIADLVVLIRDHRIAPVRARGADVALVTSGMLMAVGYDGIGGVGGIGLWGPLLFSIPLLAAWYSFELLASTRRNFQQTIEALGSAAELAGLVRPGHVERVAELTVAMGDQLGMSETEIEQLSTAALLHHLGAVCLDAPGAGAQLDPGAVAEAGATMLRASEVLAPAGDIVAAEPSLHRPPTAHPQPESALSGQVLKVASAFDELTDGRDEHASWALEALYTGPLYVYDGRVVGALERVLDRRGVLVARV